MPDRNQKSEAKKKPGLSFGFFFSILWIIRFIVEYAKEPQVAERADWLFNTGQLLSLPFIVIGFGIVYWSLQRDKKKQIQ